MVEEELGPVDLLVNNAAVAGQGGLMWENDPDEWALCMDVNLRGPYLCSRSVLPGMITRNRGRIITTASGVGLSGLWPCSYVPAYSISKCAVIRFSEILADQTKEHGISAFAINPGFVRTAMTEAQAESPVDDKWLRGWFKTSLAAGHDILPERAAELVLFLASSRADVLTGCYIDVVDNVEEMVRRAEEIQEKQLYTLRLRT